MGFHLKGIIQSTSAHTRIVKFQISFNTVIIFEPLLVITIHLNCEAYGACNTQKSI